MTGSGVRDLSGQRFHKLVVLRQAGSVNGRTTWECVCDCGQTTIAHTDKLKSGHKKSCGCFRTPRHGGARKGLHAPEYGVWSKMRQRCTNPKERCYPNYGGRGISVCAEWSRYEVFLADMGPRPSSSHSIDRIDVNGNYEPSNCRWATTEVQQSNRRNNLLVEYNGETICAVELARRAGLPPQTVHQRIRRGWPIEQVILPAGDPGIKRAKRKRASAEESHAIKLKQWASRRIRAAARKSLAEAASKTIVELQAQVDRLSSQVEGMREALRPFARLADGLRPELSDAEVVADGLGDDAREVTVGHFRKARALTSTDSTGLVFSKQNGDA